MAANTVVGSEVKGMLFVTVRIVAYRGVAIDKKRIVFFSVGVMKLNEINFLSIAVS